jgi:hypothetical protein
MTITYYPSSDSPSIICLSIHVGPYSRFEHGVISLRCIDVHSTTVYAYHLSSYIKVLQSRDGLTKTSGDLPLRKPVTLLFFIFVDMHLR